MPLRARMAILLAATFAVAAAFLATLGQGADAPPPRPGDVPKGAYRPPNIPPTELRLRDQDGELATLAGARGEVAVVTFLYTTCEDTCPLTVQQIRGALDELGRDVPVYAIAVDPPRDTAEKARRFIAQQRMTGRMRFLLGTREQLARQWKAYGIQRQSAKTEHSGHVVLLDKGGVQRIGFPADKLTPDDLAHDIRLLEAEAAPSA